MDQQYLDHLFLNKDLLDGTGLDKICFDNLQYYMCNIIGQKVFGRNNIKQKEIGHISYEVRYQTKILYMQCLLM